MSTKHNPTSSLWLLVGQAPKPKTWLKILNARLDLIKPYLDSFTFLEALGSSRCLSNGFGKWHSIGSDKPTLTQDAVFQNEMVSKHLGIWGEFDSLALSRGRISPDSFPFSHHTWGISMQTRSWVHVTLNGERNKDEEERAIELQIRADVSLEKILELAKIKPEVIWFSLGEAIKRFASEQRRLLDISTAIARVVELEEKVLNAIQAKDAFQLA